MTMWFSLNLVYSASSAGPQLVGGRSDPSNSSMDGTYYIHVSAASASSGKRFTK